MELIQILAIAGFMLSLYEIYVYYRLAFSTYKPICDISKHISCSKAALSSYGNLIGIPNGYLGLIFFTVVFFFYSLPLIDYILAIALLYCVVMAYISYVIQKNVCLICTGIYIVIIWSAFLVFI